MILIDSIGNKLVIDNSVGNHVELTIRPVDGSDEVYFEFDRKTDLMATIVGLQVYGSDLITGVEEER